MPGARGGPPQFRTDGPVLLSKQQENGIGPAVGVEVTGLDEGLDESGREPSLCDQIPTHAPELVRLWRRYGQSRLLGDGSLLWRDGLWESQPQPLDRLLKTKTVQMDHQIDSPATTAATGPVHELGPGDRQHSLRGVPLMTVVAVGLSAAEAQDRFQGDEADLLGQVPELRPGHDSEFNGPRRVLHSRMLKT